MGELNRQLILLRHGKSRWDESDKTDFERGLSPRGVKAAKSIGKWLRNNKIIPNIVLTSASVRTQDTWKIIEKKLGSPVRVKTLRTLYLASPSRIFEVLSRQPPEFTRALIVGHNPGLHRLALNLLRDMAPEPLLQNLPTCALVRMQIDSHDWANFDNVNLLDYIEPRRLKIGTFS